MTYGDGSITKTPTGYRVRVYDGRGKRCTIGTYPTWEQAEAARVAAVVARDGLGLGVTLREYGADWLDRIERAGQDKSWRSVWNTTVSAAPFVNAPIDTIVRAEVRQWARELPFHVSPQTGRTISHQTAKHALGALRRCLTEAVEDGLLDANPAKEVRLPRKTKAAEGWTWLRLHELDAVLSLPTLTDEQRAVYTLAAYSGLRAGEVAALTWDRVELDAGWLVVSASWDRATKSTLVRRVPLLEPAAEALQSWGPKQGLVFPGRRGALRAKGYDWRWVKDGVAKAAGIARRVRFHDLRHTCASHLVSGTWGHAWPLSKVREFLGHTEEKTTERYAHLAPEAMQSDAAKTAKRVRNGSGRLAALARELLAITAAGDEELESPTLGSGSQQQFGDSSAELASGPVPDPSASQRLLEAVRERRPVAPEIVEAVALERLNRGEWRLILRALRGDDDALTAAIDLAELRAPASSLGGRR